MILFNFFPIAQESYKDYDDLITQGNYAEAYNLLLSKYDPAKPDLKIIWRIGLACYEYTEIINDKNKKIEWHDKAVNLMKPYIDINYGEKRDRAQVIQWYTINYASKMRLLGIFGGRESMEVVPYMFKMMDKSQSIDPTFAGSYLFEAKLHEDVPFFLGGDKNKMGVNYLYAIDYADEKEKIIMLYEAANSFYKRNWSADKRKEEAAKANITKNDYTKYSDREYSYILLNEAKNIYESKTNTMPKEKIIYKKVVNLLREIERKKN
jgi:hypothetical protein